MTIWGRAWAATGVKRVDVSADDGLTWRPATVEAREQCSWQAFSFTWRPAKTGVITIASRATDLDGATQPRDEARNEIHTVTVQVT